MSTSLVWVSDANAAIEQVTAAAERLARANNRVRELEDERALVKARCIKAMIGTPNPLSKTGQEPHSASSAEKIVEEHLEYHRHRQLQADAEVERLRAEALYVAAKLRAKLAVALVEGDAERSR